MDDRMTVRAKVTSKGQVTIPKPVREQLGIRPGDEVEFIDDRGVVRVQRHRDAAAWDKWAGYLKHLKGKDVDELVREMRGD